MIPPPPHAALTFYTFVGIGTLRKQFDPEELFFFKGSFMAGPVPDGLISSVDPKV